MLGKRLFLAGAVSTLVAAICCFTPVLVIALGALGLGALVGGLDPVLFAVLGAGIAIMGVGLWIMKRPTSS